MEDLKEILRKILGHIEFESEMALLTDGKIDSVDLVELVVAIEEKFQIEIPLEDIVPGNFDSLQGIWDMVKNLSRKKNQNV